MYDLAEGWKQLTGLPFVFAVWVSNKKLEDNFVMAFNYALKGGVDHISKVISELPEEATAYKGFDVKAYFYENISYAFDEEKKKAMELFLSYLPEELQAKKPKEVPLFSAEGDVQQEISGQEESAAHENLVEEQEEVLAQQENPLGEQEIAQHEKVVEQEMEEELSGQEERLIVEKIAGHEEVVVQEGKEEVEQTSQEEAEIEQEREGKENTDEQNSIL
jgi:hypothetical protein